MKKRNFEKSRLKARKLGYKLERDVTVSSRTYMQKTFPYGIVRPDNKYNIGFRTLQTVDEWLTYIKK